MNVLLYFTGLVSEPMSVFTMLYVDAGLIAPLIFVAYRSAGRDVRERESRKRYFVV